MKHKSIMQVILLSVLVCLVCLASPSTAMAQKEKDDLALTLQNVSGNVYCLEGAGGNVGILKTPEGLLVIDSKVGQVTDAVLKELTALSAPSTPSALSAAPLKIKYLINTHYHGDHTANDEALAKYAETIVMHPNCKASLIKSLKEKAAEKTFISKIQTWKEGMVINLGGETVRLLYFNPAHTSGDLAVVFEKAKVLQTGDLFFNGMPAYIDVKDGSDTGNWVETIETLCREYPDYKIIPGHGEAATVKDYLAFAEYLKHLRKETADAIKAGKTREQAMESINTDQFKQIKANELGNFMTIKTNIGWIYDEMAKKK